MNTTSICIWKAKLPSALVLFSGSPVSPSVQLSHGKHLPVVKVLPASTIQGVMTVLFEYGLPVSL